MVDTNDDDDWGDFGGFQSATDENLAPMESNTLTWAASFTAASVTPGEENKTFVDAFAQPAAPDNISQLQDMQPMMQSPPNTASPIPAAVPTPSIPPATGVGDEVSSSTPIVPIAPTESTFQNAVSPTGTQSMEPSHNKENVIPGPENKELNAQKKDETVAKLHMTIENLKSEKESIESKLAHTLLLLDEQKKLNEEMRLQTQKEIEEMEKTSKVALSVILEEHRRQTKEAILENQQRCLLDSKAALDSQAEETNKRFQAQKEEYDKNLEEEKKKRETETEEMLSELKLQFQEEQNTKLAEVEKQWEEKYDAALEKSREECLEKFNSQLEAEKANYEKQLGDIKNTFEESLDEERQKFQVETTEALKKQRDEIWESVQILLEEERNKWRLLSDELSSETREKTIKYMKDKEKIDSLARRRHLSSVELLLTNVQSQLKELVVKEEKEDQVGIDEVDKEENQESN